MSADNPSIAADEFIPHPIESVWTALTDARQLANWFMPNNFQAELGHRFTFDNGRWGTIHCEVTELRPPNQLTYEWRSGVLNTTVTWRLVSEGNGTRVILEHRGFDLNDLSQRAAFDAMRGGSRGLAARGLRLGSQRAVRSPSNPSRLGTSSYDTSTPSSETPECVRSATTKTSETRVPERERLGASFWRFWGACVLANLGDGIRMAAFPLLAASLTSDPVAVAAVGAAAALPWLVTGLVAGSLADRKSARHLLVGADAVRILVLLLLVITLLTGTATIALTAATAFALGVAETLRDTTAQVVVPRLVPPALLERANGRLVSGEVVGNEFVGPLVGSALFAAGVALPFAANSATLAIAILLVLSVPASLLSVRPSATDDVPVREGVRAGLGWLAQHRVLRGLIVSAALVALADAAWFAIFVLYVQVQLSAGPLGFGVYLAVGAGGGLAGALVAERLIAGRRHRGVLLGSMAVTAMMPALLLAAPTVTAALVVVIATSAGFGVLNVAAVSVRQRLTPAGLLGRVTAAWRTVVFGAAAVGALSGGAIASWQGLHAPFALSAAIGVLAVVLWWLAARGGFSTQGPTVA